jgi:hypothetical protein
MKMNGLTLSSVAAAAAAAAAAVVAPLSVKKYDLVNTMP